MKAAFRSGSILAVAIFLSSCDAVDPEPATGPDQATMRGGESTGREVASRSERTPGSEAWDFVYWEDDSADRLNPVQEARPLEKNFAGAFSDVFPVADLIAFYPFNGNANDKSGRGNHGSVVGASLTTNRFGMHASAYAFDGNGDYILVPHSSSLNVGEVNSSYSVAAWLKGSSPSRSRIIQKWDEIVSTPYPFSLRAEPNNVNHALYDGSQANILALSDIWDGQWHHVVFTIDLAANVQHGYVDGNLVSMQSLTVTGPLSNTVPMTIGAGLGVARDFLGTIDDVVIYGRAYTMDEVRRLYQYTR